MKQKYIDLYLDWAERASQLSYAKRLNVGAVIVKDDIVISYGYNGMPGGWDNDCEYKEYTLTQHADYLDEDGSSYNLKTRPEVLHAESNAIAKLARSSNSGKDADIFITHSPCLECAKLIFQSGIRRVFYRENYRDDTGIKFLEKSGVGVNQIERNNKI